MTRIADIQNYFDRHAPRYDELASTISFQLEDAYQYLVQYALAANDGKETIRILDLGIGTGRLSQKFLELGSNTVITGVDISEQMIAEARKNLAQYKSRVSLICGSFPEAIADTQYDCVVSGIALSFYPTDFAAVFRTVHQVLMRGSLFVYAVNVAQSASSVDNIIAKMLARKMSATVEQLDWLRQIKQNMTVYQVPYGWHILQLQLGGFTDIDCIYLRHKLAVFSAAKPNVAI